jgi:hypothetical protein
VDRGDPAGQLAVEAWAADSVGAGARSVDAADVGRDFVERVAELDDVPARLGERRHVHDHRLLAVWTPFWTHGIWTPTSRGPKYADLQQLL